MIIIETCPECGHDLQDLVLTTYPPIPQKKCFNCGWSWTGKREEIVRVPFAGDELIVDDLVDKLTDYTVLNLTDFTLVDNENIIASGTIKVNDNNSLAANFGKSPCENCLSNPKNGGDGICYCTLGQQTIY